MAAKNHDSVIPLLFAESLDEYFTKNTASIKPAFPNWEKSFVSGPKSTLFQVDHRIDLQNPHLLFTKIKFMNSAEGPPGHVHGGATAGLIDEIMGITLWHNQFMSMTKELHLFYRKALPLTQTIYGVTEVTAVNDRTTEIRSTLYDEEKVAHVSAQATFYRLTPEQLSKFAKVSSIA